MMASLRIAAVNLGSTSTKIAYYEDLTCVLKDSIPHDAASLRRFSSIWDQYDYRKQAICDYLEQHGIQIESLDAFVSRGGQTKPIPGGVYRINAEMVEQVTSGRYGQHVTDIGVKIAYEMGLRGPIALTANTPSTDELWPIARYSGLPEIPRRSCFHALNHKAVAQQYAQECGIPYEKLNLIVVHMGGGVSVASHLKGRMVDAPDALDGEGPFSTNRCGSLPVGALAKLCFSGVYTRQEIMRKLNGVGGLAAYIGETDCRAVEQRANDGDTQCRDILEAMCYQIAKEIGAQAAVLSGRVDAILFTGGISYSKYIVQSITGRVAFIAPCKVYPGEFEMEALCKNAYLALTGQADILKIQDVTVDVP